MAARREAGEKFSYANEAITMNGEGLASDQRTRKRRLLFAAGFLAVRRRAVFERLRQSGENCSGAERKSVSFVSRSLLLQRSSSLKSPAFLPPFFRPAFVTRHRRIGRDRILTASQSADRPFAIHSVYLNRNYLSSHEKHLIDLSMLPARTSDNYSE